MKRMLVFGFALFNLLLLSGVSFAFAQSDPALGEYLTDIRALAAAIGIGVAAGLGALGQGRAGAAALESIGRNPESLKSLFTPMILILALIESLVIFALVVSLKLAMFF
ncbi:MAG: ATP synthase F0 subunit C [Deltaproteobacteria bacterium]|jgi:F-type H+-transporting ATPase subunit c|nr:ATP synthase F0 subunit C [Deltaproteobacteria bacterium]